MKKTFLFHIIALLVLLASCKSEDTKEQGMLTKGQEVINKEQQGATQKGEATSPMDNIEQKNSNNAFASAVEYNNYIIGKQKDVLNDILMFSSEQDASKGNKIMTDGVSKIDQHIKDLQNMPAWKGNTTFRDKAIDLFKFYKEMFATDYTSLLDGKDTEDLTKITGAQSSITEKEGKLEEAFIKAQKDFATANNIPLADNPMQKQVNSMSAGREDQMLQKQADDLFK